jgi:NAD dependent epimerase/dehydratase
MTNRVLVTGADGFIGSHLTESLVREGYDVRAMVFYNSFGSWGWLDRCSPDVKGLFEVVQGDIRDPYLVKQLMVNCKYVIHLAALIAIPYSYQAPESYVQTNISGTLNILQAGKELETQRIIHTSTSEVYGSALTVPITEDHPLQGQSPYSATKIAADQLVNSFYASFDLPVLTLRPFNTFGPRQSARAIIPTIITQLVAKNKSLKLGTIAPTRDFTYIEDTVSAFVSAIKSEKGLGQVFNIGSSFEVSIGETAHLIADLMGISKVLINDNERLRPVNSEVQRLCAANTKLKDTFGWDQKYGGIEGFKKGLLETIDWFSNPENKGLYKSALYNI